MKKLILILLICSVSLMIMNINQVFGDSAQENLDKANHELGENVFPNAISGSKRINQVLATEGLSVSGAEKKLLFVYGSEVEASAKLGIEPLYKYLDENGAEVSEKDIKGRSDVKKTYRAMGFTFNNKPFPHPAFPPDIERIPGRTTRWYTVAELLGGSAVARHASVNRWLGDVNDRHDRYRVKLANDAFDPDNFEGLHEELEHRSRLSYDEQDYLDLSEISYILQPSTEDAWGLAIFFHYEEESEKLLYSAAVMKPFSLYEGEDLSEDISVGGDGFEIDYNILQRNIAFNLGNSKAQFSPSGRNWIGTPAGRLNVYNDTPQIYKEFEVTDNPDVYESDTVIFRDPVIHALVRRQDFTADNNIADNPLEGVYGVTNSKTGQVSADGTVSWSYRTSCNRKDCTSSHRRTAHADFSRIINKQEITVNVYNGMESINPPKFKDQIDNNNTSTAVRKLWWTSSPISLPVIRLMYDQYEDDSLSEAIPVNGRYDRSFIEQNAADLKWDAPVSMEKEYQADREKARRRDYSSDGSARAVFASDVSLRNKDYPIRSGYYFNPRGIYAFTLKTEIYKDKPGDTEEHRELVEAITEAFRYESNMVYITPAREAVTIAGNPAYKTGTAYMAVRDSASVSSHPLFDIQAVAEYSLDKEEQLSHDYSEEGTDSRFKAVLEGYANSGTEESVQDYKYTEFVRDDAEVYKITETTKVTITVNPKNEKIYTHAQLKNGAYYLRAYIDNVAVGALTGGRLDTLVGISWLDDIRIDVVGSMYDDAY